MSRASVVSRVPGLTASPSAPEAASEGRSSPANPSAAAAPVPTAATAPAGAAATATRDPPPSSASPPPGFRAGSRRPRRTRTRRMGSRGRKISAFPGSKRVPSVADVRRELLPNLKQKNAIRRAVAVRVRPGGAAEALERGEPARFGTRATRVQVCHDLVQRGALGLHRLVAGRSRERRRHQRQEIERGARRRRGRRRRHRVDGEWASAPAADSEATFEVVTRARSTSSAAHAACASASASCSFARSLAISPYPARRAAISPASAERSDASSSARKPASTAARAAPRRRATAPPRNRPPTSSRAWACARPAGPRPRGRPPEWPPPSAAAAASARAADSAAAASARSVGSAALASPLSRATRHTRDAFACARLLGSLGHLRERLVGAFQVRDERRAFLPRLVCCGGGAPPGAASPSARATPRPPRASRASFARLSASLRLRASLSRLSRPPPRGALCSRPSPSSAGASFQFGSRPGGRTRARRRASRSLSRALAFLRRLGAFARGRRERRSGLAQFRTQSRVIFTERRRDVHVVGVGVAPRALARLRRRRLLLGLERGGRERVLRPERQGRHVRRERVLVVFRVETTRLVVRGALVLRRRGARLGDDSRAGGRRRDGRLFVLRRLRLLRLVLVVLVRLGVHERAGRAARTPRRNRVGTHVGNRGGVGVRFVRRRDRGRARVEPGARASSAGPSPPRLSLRRSSFASVVQASSGSVVAQYPPPSSSVVVCPVCLSPLPPTTRARGSPETGRTGRPAAEASFSFPARRRRGAVVPAARRARGAPRLTEQSIVHARVALALAFRLALLRLRSRANELHTMGFVQLVGAAAARRAAASAASRLSTESDAPRVEEDVAGFALAGLDAAF